MLSNAPASDLTRCFWFDCPTPPVRRYLVHLAALEAFGEGVQDYATCEEHERLITPGGEVRSAG